MQVWFTQQKHRFALWIVRMLTGTGTVIPAPTLAALEAEVQSLTDYIAQHSGRLNDGTTRTVRRKLRHRAQMLAETLDASHSLERLALR